MVSSIQRLKNTTCSGPSFFPFDSRLLLRFYLQTTYTLFDVRVGVGGRLHLSGAPKMEESSYKITPDAEWWIIRMKP